MTVLRWIARSLSAALLGLFCMFWVGEGPPPIFPPCFLTFEVGLLVLCLAGLVVAFRAELLGGTLGLAGSAGFYLANFAASGFHRFPGGWVFPLLLITPMLYLVVWWGRRTSGGSNERAAS